MNGKTQFTKLLEAAQIGSLTLKNRMIMAPMGSALSNEVGLVTEEMKSYYETRAELQAPKLPAFSR